MSDLEKALVEKWRWEARAVFGQILRKGDGDGLMYENMNNMRAYVSSLCTKLNNTIREEYETVLLAQKAINYPEGSPGRQCAESLIEQMKDLRPEEWWKGCEPWKENRI